jgi:hypothetical protein
MPSFELMQHWGAVCWDHQVGMQRDPSFQFLACPVGGCRMSITDEVLRRSGWTKECYYPLLVNSEVESVVEHVEANTIRVTPGLTYNVTTGSGGGGGTVSGGGGSYHDGTGGAGGGVPKPGTITIDALGRRQGGGGGGGIGLDPALKRAMDAIRDTGRLRYWRT